MQTHKDTELEKRTWAWIMTPESYEITCDLCGGTNITWSEYVHHIWCYDCEKDTIGTGGIFSGPIPYHLCNMMGLSFDRIDITTGKRLYFHDIDGHSQWLTSP